MIRKALLVAWILAALAAPSPGVEPLALIDAEKPSGGWEFGNGPEFPGARGKLELAAERYRDRPVLRLEGDFRGGGNYVQAALTLPEVPVEAISFWANTPAGSDQLPVRLVDGSGQCHQIRLKVSEKGGWQRIDLPVEEYFKKMGTSSALDIASQYEKWGGANDGRWHQPGRLLVFLFSRGIGVEGSVLLSDVLLHPSSAQKAGVAKVIRLDEVLQAGEIDWGFNLGQEFPGAKGGLDPVPDLPEKGKFAMRLHADFTGGGGYVGVRKSFANLDVRAMNVLRFKMRSETTGSFALRLVDGAGQTHQRKGIPFQPDGRWHEVEIVPTEIAGQEHWGGANDGQWRDSVQLIELMLNPASHEGKKPDLFITDMRADVIVEARVQPAAFAETFDDDAARERWQTTGDVTLDAPGEGDAGKAFLLRRDLKTVQTETAATSRPFDVDAGAWQVAWSCKAALHSPDNSYHGSIGLEVLDRSGGLLETVPLAIGFGRQDWQTESKSFVLPAGAAKARFRLQLNKTYGSFWVDRLSASPLSTQPVEQRVERILLSSQAVGNLFFPGEPVVIQATVEASKPLPAAEQRLRFSVRDGWGAEQAAPSEVALERGPRKDGRFTYSAEIRLPENLLAVGKFYELHVEVSQDADEPAGEYTGVAVLPRAATKDHDPEQVPFTIRNWDSRVSAYFHLADRLGLRLLGIWGGWESKPPYRPHAPGIDIVKQLGAKWITGTPAASVERKGFEEYSEEALRQGMRNFLEQYAAEGMAMIALGNEPHGTGEKVLENVRAYKAVYEAVKAFDPKIHVIGTSVEPNEEYFKAGYQNYLDSYDFHIYEHYSNVRRTMREYRALMEKYRAVKPIHSTELGLNSQGQTRQAVAVEMVKKCTVFFAEGGATVSWFTIQYPDPQGKARGQFGDAHCVFDCKYSLYNPRLDAVTHYNVVNGIGVKRFVEERQHPGGAQAFLFRDVRGNCLQVLWLDERREDVQIPLPSGEKVEVVRIDGARTTLTSAAEGIGLSLSAEPVMLLYRDEKGGLAQTLGAPAVKLVSAPEPVAPGAAATFALEGPGLSAASLRVEGPAPWGVRLAQAGANRVAVTVQSPKTTAAREARFHVRWPASGSAAGELLVSVPVAQADRRAGPSGDASD